MLDATEIYRLRIFFCIFNRQNTFVLQLLFDIYLNIRLLNIFCVHHGFV